jgi:hypothetical protein
MCISLCRFVLVRVGLTPARLYALPFFLARFDGGYSDAQKEALKQLLKKYQPHAVGFQGQDIMPSPLKWGGTESGYPPYPIWSTGCANASGDPTASDYCPTAVDTYIQVRFNMYTETAEKGLVMRADSSPTKFHGNAW